MKRLAMFFLIGPLLAVIPIGLPKDVGAHGTGHRLLKHEPVVAVEFHYSDDTPMRYAEVMVFSPRDLKVEHQNGRTDRNGKFVFCPDVPGKWLIKVNDGMGHEEKAVMEVGPEAIAGQSENPRTHPASGGSEPLSKALKIIAGLSLIMNVSFAGYFVKRRSTSAKTSYQ
jgi:nickel transport protein